MTTIDPAATPSPLEADIAELKDNLGSLVALLTAQAQAPAASTDGAAVASSPAPAPSDDTAPVSSVPSPRVGSVVTNTHTPAGAEWEIQRYGVVVTVDDTQNVGGVCWFLSEPITIAGDALIKVD